MYKINAEMLGYDAKNEDAEYMVELLIRDGYEVEYTDNMGMVNSDNENPVSMIAWSNALNRVIDVRSY